MMWLKDYDWTIRALMNKCMNVYTEITSVNYFAVHCIMSPHVARYTYFISLRL